MNVPHTNDTEYSFRHQRSAYGNLCPRRVSRTDAHFRFNLIQQDPDDNKFVDCAIASNAKYIVTEDHHFDILKHISFPRVEVITLKDFIDTL